MLKKDNKFETVLSKAKVHLDIFGSPNVEEIKKTFVGNESDNLPV